MNDRIISEKTSIYLIASGFLLILLFLIAFCYKSVFFKFDLPVKHDVLGQFGDIIGGVVGTLWSLAGVILFYTSLKQQREDIQTNRLALEKQIAALNKQNEEIELQREEYKMARDIFSEQKEVLKEQTKTSRIQQFESNFYSLLDIYIKIRNELVLQNASPISVLNKKIIDDAPSFFDMKINIKNLRSNYDGLYYSNKEKISRYLKTIYRLYKVIDEQDDLDSKSKYFYSKIVRSQFTEDELFLIYYNSFSSYGKNFRVLILRYNILKHLSLTAKAEFKIFNEASSKICADRLTFINWLDDFMISNHEKMIDISIDEPICESIYYSDGDSLLNIKMSLTDDDDICFLINFSGDKFLTTLFFETSFEQFFKNYIYDRFIHNNLEEIDSFDSVEVKSSAKSATYEYIFKTKKKLKFNTDAY